MDGSRSLCVAVAGGTGRLGRRLSERLSRRFTVRVLSRRAARFEEPGSSHPGAPGISTVRCDLLSVPQTEVALAGADVLVHLARPAPGPSRFVDTDDGDVAWLMADSVARAAPRTSVRRVVAYPCERADPTVAALRASGLPVVTPRGSADALDELDELICAPEPGDREPPREGQAEPAAAPGGGGPPPESASARPEPAGTSPEPVGATSIQRHALPPGWSAGDVADAYFEWLGAHVPSVRTERRDQAWIVRTGGLAALRLRFSPGASRPGSHVLEVRDGYLLRAGSTAARFEFRVPLGSDAVLTVLNAFAPALPWSLYRATQAPLHAASMRAFGRWLEARAAATRR